MILQFVLGILLVGSLVSAIMPVRRGWKLAQASESWPRVRGQIVHSNAESQPPHSMPKLEYAYRVNDADYHAAAIAYGLATSQRAFLEELRCQPGDVVWVYYNPENPAQAVLSPGGSPLRKVLAEPIVLLNLVFSSVLLLAFVFFSLRDLLA